MTEKYMTAAEFAAFCGVTKDTLLWYDKQGILKPAAKGANGYRYYSSRQFFDLSTIMTLKQTGNSLKEILAFQQEHSYEELQKRFAEKSGQLDTQLRELTRMKCLVDAIRENLALAGQFPMDTPELIRQDTEYLAITQIPEGYGWFEKEPGEYVFAHIRAYQGMDGVSQYPLGTILAGAGLNSSAPEEIAYFYPAEPGVCPGLWEKPAGLYVRIFYRGNYGRITNALKLAADYMKQNGLFIHGPIYEYDCVTYLAKSEEDHVQMLLIPVEEKATDMKSHLL